MDARETERQCLSEPTLVAYVEGGLSDAEARRAEIHLDACAECLRVVALLGTSDAEPPGSRYTIGDEIARGGMGRILAAWDETLDRAVAIKTVHNRDALTRERFAREMVVTARLQHPSIVPVYDGGTLDDGAPYYAMRRVDGRELEACIREASTPAQRLELLRPFIALVDAIAYAHSQGFVHRDLKPRNVLVGPFGETVVLDWGLARSVDATPEGGVSITRDSTDGGITHTGAVMGTPGYIAPESLRGEPATPTSDVYSLGVILVQIMTGHAREDALLRAPGMPADLVAIARRAVHARPEERYPDARALADDLRRFEAGRLVDARAYGLFDRVSRFVRRHLAAVTVASLASIVLLATGGWSYRSVAAARDRAEAALGEAQAQQQVAESERESAEALIDFALEDLSAQLRQVGRIDLMRGLVEQVDAYYVERTPRTDRDSAVRRGRALRLHGSVASNTGDHATAEDKLQQARALLRDVEADEDAEALRCDVLYDLAFASRGLGRLDEAEAATRECAELATRRLAQQPDAPQWLLALAGVEMVQVLVHQDRGQTEEANRLMATVLRRVEGRRFEGDDEAQAANLRRLVGSRLAGVAMHDRRFDDALRHGRAALASSETLRRLRPGNTNAVAAVAGARMELAQTLQAMKLHEEAQRELEIAVGTYRLLLELEPSNAVWTRNLSLARRNLADVEFSRGRSDDAIATTRENISDIATFVDEQAPQASEMASDLGFLHVELGDLLRRSGQADAAAAEFERGIAEMERAAAGRTEVGPLRRLGFALLLHGDYEIARGNLERARTSLERARELARQHRAPEPTPGERIDVATPTVRLVVIAWKQGDADRARALLREAMAEIEAAGVPADDLRAMLAEPARALGETI
jgi:tetratricopeptide (TPR) repeat protein